MPVSRPLVALAALAPVAALFLAGCAGPDLVLPNPMVAGAVPQNMVVKQHGFSESHRGLPVGSMSDKAVINEVSAAQVCVTVNLHELSAIDVTTGSVKLSSDTATAAVPAITPEPPTHQTFQGLNPVTVKTGTRLVCRDSGGQTVCETQPITQTTMVPGPVDVFATGGRICAPNQGLVTPQTKKLSLDISIPTTAPGVMGYGHGSKGDVFRWEFH